MFPFKRFVQGPNLHEESLELNATNFSQPPTQAKTITGEEAKKIYEEIISSTSSGRSSRKKSNSSTDRTLRSGHKLPKKEKEPRKTLTLNQLMRLCETNNISELAEYLEPCPDN